jgi:hypothetical protein
MYLPSTSHPRPLPPRSYPSFAALVDFVTYTNLIMLITLVILGGPKLVYSAGHASIFGIAGSPPFADGYLAY